MDKVQKRDLNNILVKLQKPIVLLLVFSIMLVLVYSLVFMTSFYKLSLLENARLTSSEMEAAGFTYDMFPVESYFLKENSSAKLGLRMGYFTKLFADNGALQTFNHWIFNVGIIGLVITFLLYVYFAQKRKRYYVTNFISYGIVFVFDLYVGFSILSKLAMLKSEVALVNYEVINVYYKAQSTVTEAKLYGADSFNWVFVLGNTIAVVLLIAVVLGIALVVTKAIYQIKNKPIDVSEVKINE